VAPGNDDINQYMHSPWRTVLSSFKKIAWSGSAVLLALVLSLGLVAPQKASAAATITPAAVVVIPLTTNSTNGTGAFTALGGPIIVTCAAAADVGVGTVAFTAPLGWAFSGVGVVTFAGGAAGSAALTLSPDASTISATVTTACTGAGAAVTITGATIRPIQSTSVSGNVTFNLASSTATVVGVATGTLAGTITAGAGFVLPYRLTLQAVTAAASCTLAGTGPFVTAPTLPADGSQSFFLCAILTDSAAATQNASNPVTNTLVTYTVSLGTVSTGTAKTVNSFTIATPGATAGTSSTNYRGGGNVVATDTAIASVASPISVVATMPINLIAASGLTASKVTLTSPAVLAVAPQITNTNPNYQSPQIGTTGSFQVVDATGLGVNGQVVLLTTDKGYLIENAGFTQYPTLAGACAAATAKSITITTGATRAINTPLPGSAAGIHNVLSVGGTGVAGAGDFTFCGNQLDAPGKATITAQNISTTMANATVSLSMAGRPGKITATATGNAMTATVVDAGGNNVADGTPVRFTISPNAGAVSTACTTTTNGAASAVVSLIAPTGTVIVSTDWNETGGVATCGAAGAQQLATSVTVPGGTGTAVALAGPLVPARLLATTSR
jgi:hypothetical protein